MKKLVIALLFVLPVRAADMQPVPLVMENQFEEKVQLADHRGSVVILVYGDRKGTDACRKLGEELHVAWHPTAAGQPADKAKLAPVAGGGTDVKIIPVACCGKVPGAVRGVISKQIAKGSPDVPVWLDYTDAMKTRFTLTSGEPNIVVFDANGHLRLKINGTPDQPALDKLMKTAQALRDEVKPR